MFCAKVSSKTPVNFVPDIYVIHIYKNRSKCVYHKFFCVSENLQYEDCFISPVSS